MGASKEAHESKEDVTRSGAQGSLAADATLSEAGLRGPVISTLMHLGMTATSPPKEKLRIVDDSKKHCHAATSIWIP